MGCHEMTRVCCPGCRALLLACVVLVASSSSSSHGHPLSAQHLKSKSTSDPCREPSKKSAARAKKLINSTSASDPTRAAANGK
eukprot:312273-Hanusia_phi.AAC.1